jgi:hypothetical protein
MAIQRAGQQSPGPIWSATGQHARKSADITIGSIRRCRRLTIYDQWTYGYKDVATKVLNSQTIKFGFDFTRLYYLNDSDRHDPNYTFYNIWDFLNDAPEAEGGPFPERRPAFPADTATTTARDIFGAFFQDDWKMTTQRLL